MISKKIGEISFEDLKSYTNDFSEDNFIGNFQFGKGYRGKIEDFDIIVKVWTENTAPCGCFLDGTEIRMQDELILHTESRINSHPDLTNMIGCCHKRAIVYDLNPKTLRTFIVRESYSPKLIPKEVVEFSFEDLQSCTDNFSKDNFIANFQFGKVYRGKVGDYDVTVKVWMPQTLYACLPGHNEKGMEDELLVHTNSRIRSHPNLAKLIGFCHEGQLSVVYDLNPLDTLRTFIPRDDFTWAQRIRTALQLAFLLQFLHIPCPPHKRYIICNIEAAHFFLDKDYNLVLYDFSMFTHGNLLEMRRRPRICSGCYGYIDPDMHWAWERFYPTVDVFAFGIILIGLITKKAFIVEDCEFDDEDYIDGTTFLDDWAFEEYERRTYGSGDKVSLVHESLEVDPDFESADGLEATDLAMQCFAERYERPRIDEVVQQLLKLQVLRDTLNLWAFNGLKSGGTKKISKEIEEISFEDLKSYTNNFSEDNFIGNFQYGKVYRGKIGNHDVTVKVWMPETPESLYLCPPKDNENRIEGELILHTDSRIKSHPNLARLIGYCREGQLAVVYDLNPVDTLRTFLLRDDFTWLQRIKTALQLACLLQFLHTPPPPYKPYLVCNIEAAHFVLDKDYNLVLYDFSMFTGGLLPETSDYRGTPSTRGCFGYTDYEWEYADGWFYPGMDVFAFGIILVGLIAKKAFIVEELQFDDIRGADTTTYLNKWASAEYKSRKSKSGDKVSLVHESLEVDPDFESADGLEATKLAMQCMDQLFCRAKIDEVVECLKLLAFQGL
ncbi:hypothetical protein COLO4_18336 [Corchorus olitorius]|uniref:Protein kinase domain-containing protein n=1 Tax=Corchorus olitorius TaxID=93759 RepID=A0A1R3J9I0_9ROSI|nr:hypothetical protein COLO4_18336 [Corchorus olitorius]